MDESLAVSYQRRELAGYDVTEATTTKPVPYGVHTSPRRAVAPRDWLIKKAQAAREAEEREKEKAGQES